MWQEQLVFSLVGGDTLTVTNAEIWQGSLTIEQSVSADDTFELGSTHIGQMTVMLINIDDDVDFMDATVVVSMAKDSDTLQQSGVYTVASAVYDSGLINITAYDNMNNLSEPYTTSLTFPSTYGAMANEITGQLLTFDGSTTAVAEKPEAEGLTKREVLGYIAQACGYNVMCNPQGYFQFVRYNLSGFGTQGQYHEISGLYSFHHSQYPVVITGTKVIVRTLVTSTDPDTGEETSEDVVTEYTAGTDAYQLVIEGNPLITTTNGQSVADALYALYGNVEFYTGDVSHISDLSIKASDIMKVTDGHNNTYPMLVSRTVISTGSAQNTSSYAEEPSRKIVTQPSQMSRVQSSVRQAVIDAKNGRRIASNTNQYFWHTSTGSDTGAHITEIPQEDFLSNPSGGNLLARSNGIAIRNGLTELAQFTSNAVNFLDGLGNTLASFGANGITIGQEIVVSSSGTLFNGDVTIRTGYIADFTLKRTNEVIFYPLYSNGGIILDNSGDMSANDVTHNVTIDDEVGDYVAHTLKYKFSAKSNNIEASYFVIQPIYAFELDDEDVDIEITVQYYDSNDSVVKTVTTTESYVASPSLLARLNLDRSTARSSSYIIVTLSLIDGSTCRAYCIYGAGTSLTYNTSEFMGQTDPNIASVYLGNDGISVNKTVGIATDGSITALDLKLKGNDQEKHIRITNNAHEEGKTYVTDGVYPHDVHFYGGNADSPVAIGLWDKRRAKPVWRYNDHDQLLYLEQNVLFVTSRGRVYINNLFKGVGDSWTVDYAGGGYVTNSGKKFQWSVPTPYITGTVSVTALTGYIRQNGNYLVGSASVTGTFPIGNITVEKMTGFVRFTYDASSAPTGVINNDVISVQLHIAFRVA